MSNEVELGVRNSSGNRGVCFWIMKDKSVIKLINFYILIAPMIDLHDKKQQ